MHNLKKLSLFIILDCYVTKNAIIDLLGQDISELKADLAKKYKPNTIDFRINEYREYLKKELEDIEIFLNDEENIHFIILDKNRGFFDNNLPKHKRKIKWFHAVDRYPFDHNIFFPDFDK